MCFKKEALTLMSWAFQQDNDNGIHKRKRMVKRWVGLN